MAFLRASQIRMLIPEVLWRGCMNAPGPVRFAVLGPRRQILAAGAGTITKASALVASSIGNFKTRHGIPYPGLGR